MLVWVWVRLEMEMERTYEEDETSACDAADEGLGVNCGRGGLG